MKVYYIYRSNQQEGPYTSEQIRHAGLTPDTYVWYQGLQEWVLAKNVDELQDLWIATPPPPLPTSTDSSQSPTKTIAGISRGTFFALVGLFAAVIGFMYFKSLREQEHIRIREKNKATEKYNALIRQKNLEFEAQQQALEEKERAIREAQAEQERLEEIHRQEAIRIAQEEKTAAYLAELNQAIQRVSQAKLAVEKAEKFQVLRTKNERDLAIQNAQSERKHWQKEVERIETAMKKIGSATN